MLKLSSWIVSCRVGIFNDFRSSWRCVQRQISDLHWCEHWSWEYFSVWLSCRLRRPKVTLGIQKWDRQNRWLGWLFWSIFVDKTAVLLPDKTLLTIWYDILDTDCQAQALFTINGCIFFTMMMGVMNIATCPKKNRFADLMSCVFSHSLSRSFWSHTTIRFTQCMSAAMGIPTRMPTLIREHRNGAYGVSSSTSTTSTVQQCFWSSRSSRSSHSQGISQPLISLFDIKFQVSFSGYHFFYSPLPGWSLVSWLNSTARCQLCISARLWQMLLSIFWSLSAEKLSLKRRIGCSSAGIWWKIFFLGLFDALLFDILRKFLR